MGKNWVSLQPWVGIQDGQMDHHLGVACSVAMKGFQAGQLGLTFGFCKVNLNLSDTDRVCKQLLVLKVLGNTHNVGSSQDCIAPARLHGCE